MAAAFLRSKTCQALKAYHLLISRLKGFIYLTASAIIVHCQVVAAITRKGLDLVAESSVSPGSVIMLNAAFTRIVVQLACLVCVLALSNRHQLQHSLIYLANFSWIAVIDQHWSSKISYRFHSKEHTYLCEF